MRVEGIEAPGEPGVAIGPERRELLGDMEKEKGRLDSEIENLRAFEREYRSRLKSYFTQQLKALDGSGEGGDLPTPDDEPKDGPRDREQAADQSQGS